MDIKVYESMAKLDLPQPEHQELSERADALLRSFAAIESVDTDGVEPLITVLDIQNIMREDIPGKYITREELLSNAPEQYNGYFQAPKTLD